MSSGVRVVKVGGAALGDGEWLEQALHDSTAGTRIRPAQEVARW